MSATVQPVYSTAPVQIRMVKAEVMEHTVRVCIAEPDRGSLRNIAHGSPPIAPRLHPTEATKPTVGGRLLVLWFRPLRATRLSDFSNYLQSHNCVLFDLAICTAMGWFYCAAPTTYVGV